MNEIPFVKYTASGNNFVIIDDIGGRVMSEADIRAFAFQATNGNFGIGADNLLVIQRADKLTLNEINEEYQYWIQTPKNHGCEFVFRMFEPSGEEALCCGNGLMCLADYLHKTYGIAESSIMTEVPLAAPNALSLGIEPKGFLSWVNLGSPRQVPDGLYQPDDGHRVRGIIDRLPPITVKFRAHDLEPYTESTSLTITGHLTFTGEPHMVIFPETDFSIWELASKIFVAPEPPIDGVSEHRERANFGTWLVRRIGYFINNNLSHLFPNGVSVNFARCMDGGNELEYRTYERGIFHETLACGTGALAVGHIARSLGMAHSENLNIFPHRCRWYEPGAVIHVDDLGASGLRLRSAPRMLCKGQFLLGAPDAEPSTARELPLHMAESNTAEHDEVRTNGLVLSS